MSVSPCTRLRSILGLILLALSLRSAAASGDIAFALQQQITQPDPLTQTLVLDWSVLEQFYRDRKLAPAWLGRNGPGSKAIQLRQTLHTADLEGLEPADYHVHTLDQIWHKPAPADRAALDILLTDAFFRYALHVRMGRLTPREADQNWHIAAPEASLARLLTDALAARDFEQALLDLPPAHIGYRRLRDALGRYRAIARQGGWPTLTQMPTLREGMRHREVRMLRQRLRADDSLGEKPVEDEYRYDKFLKHAVERFQVRHGLKMDGVVGPKTRAALNVPPTQRIAQIQINMERWRWLPRTLGTRYIIVNTAAYELAAFEDEQTLFTMWVVIGQEQRQTPVIGGTMHTVIFNPYWTVPLTLVFEDIIPAQLANPGYLKSKGIRVMANLANNIEVDPAQVDWQAYTRDTFPYVLRQDPGPENPLGRVKFLFSNHFEIYLHDTPARRLFEHKQRTFSSGCIRVEDPLQLAGFLLDGQRDWDEARIRQALQDHDTLEVSLVHRPPVYLLYLTSWVGQDGEMYFFEDIYGRDSALEPCVTGSNATS